MQAVRPEALVVNVPAIVSLREKAVFRRSSRIEQGILHS